MTKRISLSFMYYVKYANKTTLYSVLGLYNLHIMYVKGSMILKNLPFLPYTGQMFCLSGAVVNIYMYVVNRGCVPYPNILRTRKIVQTKVLSPVNC